MHIFLSLVKVKAGIYVEAISLGLMPTRIANRISTGRCLSLRVLEQPIVNDPNYLVIIIGL